MILSGRSKKEIAKAAERRAGLRFGGGWLLGGETGVGMSGGFGEQDQGLKRERAFRAGNGGAVAVLGRELAERGVSEA